MVSKAMREVEGSGLRGRVERDRVESGNAVTRSRRTSSQRKARRGVALVALALLGSLWAPVTNGQELGPQQAVVPAAPVDMSPTPVHVAKARRLILATGISRSFQIIIPEFMDQIGTTVLQSRPELARDTDAVLEKLRPEFERQSDEMIDQSARIYATLLSEKDIDAILAFFDSGAGKKYVGAQPLFLNQLVSGMQAWQQKISINMMTRVREEMKKKGHDF